MRGELVVANKKQVQSKNKTVVKANDKAQKEFKSPNDTWWGQTIIWLLIFGTVLLVVISLIVAILNQF